MATVNAHSESVIHVQLELSCLERSALLDILSAEYDSLETGKKVLVDAIVNALSNTFDRE